MIEYFVPRASSYAGHIDWLFTVIFVTVGFWFALTVAAFFYLIVRYRRRRAAAALYVTGTEHREKRWIEIPHALVILCDIVLIAATVFAWIAIKQRFPPAEATVRVVAQQWAWTFVHPGPDGRLGTGDDITTVDELHVKLGTVYHFELTSRDVLHSFAVPAFRLKQDAVPGRTITGWFQPTLAGQFDIQCTEICGIGHGLMPARVVIETKEQHEQWMRGPRA
jgi:cytochrome c oxidase subunit 2